jgi:hypothetical protein
METPSCEVELRSATHSARQLEDMLSATTHFQTSDFTLRLKRSRAPLEPPVLIALVTGGLSLLGTLITAIVTVTGRQGTIKIKARSGEEIEFPASTSAKKIEEILAIHRELSADIVELVDTSSIEPSQ